MNLDLPLHQIVVESQHPKRVQKVRAILAAVAVAFEKLFRARPYFGLCDKEPVLSALNASAQALEKGLQAQASADGCKAERDQRTQKKQFRQWLISTRRGMESTNPELVNQINPFLTCQMLLRIRHLLHKMFFFVDPPDMWNSLERSLSPAIALIHSLHFQQIEYALDFPTALDSYHSIPFQPDRFDEISGADDRSLTHAYIQHVIFPMIRRVTDEEGRQVRIATIS